MSDEVQADAPTEGAMPADSGDSGPVSKIQSDLKLEPNLLAIECVRAIAAEIATRIASTGACSEGVILASGALIGEARKLLAIRAQLRLVEQKLDEASTKLPQADGSAAADNAISAAIAPLGEWIDGIAEILDKLRVITTYEGAEVQLDDHVLQAAIANFLLEEGIAVLAPEIGPLPLRRESDGGTLFDRLVELRARVAAAADRYPDEMSELQSKLDAIAELFPGPNQQQAASAAQALLDQLAYSHADGFLLARIVSAGGRFRTRQGLFSGIFYDDVTCRGGAVVTYVLADRSSGELVDVDVLMHSTRETRVPASRIGGKLREVSLSLISKASAGKGLERRPKPKPAVELKPQSPDNFGDDSDAAGPSAAVADSAVDAVAQWRVAASLKHLIGQANVRWPNRNKKSDGTIGDLKHQQTNSDHNPRIIHKGVGVVTACDITHSPETGCDAGKIANALVASKDKRIKYVIWNRQIANSAKIGSAAPWTWRRYGGSNPHTKHVHLSVKADPILFDSISDWSLP